MIRSTLSVGVLVLLFATIAVAEEAPTPVSDNALHFRLLVGAEKPLAVAGWLDETKGTGTGYDTAFLDLDGDGVAETRQDYGMWRARPNLPERPDAKITITHEGAEWLVDLRYSQLAVNDGVAQPYIRWSVTKGTEFYAWFINGRVKFYTDRAAAAAADAIRMGPPFHFQTGTRVRGRQALVNIGLKDSNGCTLRLARKDGRQVQPHLRLLKDAEEVFQTPASYG